MRVDVTVKCGNCHLDYDDTASVDGVTARLVNSECPVCGRDNSGDNIIEPGGEQLN